MVYNMFGHNTKGKVDIAMTPYLINIQFTYPDGQEGGYNEIRVDADIESAMECVRLKKARKRQSVKLSR